MPVLMFLSVALPLFVFVATLRLTSGRPRCRPEAAGGK